MVTIYRCPPKKGALGQAGWEFARGPTKEQKEQLSLTHTRHTNICAGIHTTAHTQTKPVYCCPRALFFFAERAAILQDSQIGETHLSLMLVSQAEKQMAKSSHMSLKLCMTIRVCAFVETQHSEMNDLVNDVSFTSPVYKRSHFTETSLVCVSVSSFYDPLRVPPGLVNTEDHLIDPFKADTA